MVPEKNTDEKIRQIRFNLPELPGVYKYYDSEGNLLYVGKSNALKKRVNSYFNKNASHTRRIREMVSKIADIQYTVVNSDMEAILLECNLIKKFQPKYNILLRDGKSYPYICIKNEPFPRIFPTRTKEKDGSEYYGPYALYGTMGAILQFIKKNYKIRNCNYHLSQNNIQAGKFRPCLEFQIGNCLAPCVGKQSVESYNEQIEQIRHILKGNFAPVLEFLHQNMTQAAKNLQFETAHDIKQRIERLEQYKQKNTIISGSTADLEVVTLQTLEDVSVISHFKIQNGTVISTRAFDLRHKEDEMPQEIMEAALAQLIGEGETFFKEIVTNINMDSSEYTETYHFIYPQKGDKHKAMLLSIKNCDILLKEKILLYKEKKSDPAQAILEQLQKDLHLDRLPVHIECFDNSNIQGTTPVSSCVVFKNAKPAKREYRVFQVKTVEGPNDFATMKEVVFRRYRRLVDENQPLPDLVIIDGGKGQLSFALEALTELNLHKKIPLISIAKRLEEIYFPNDSAPLHIDRRSSSLKLIQQLRNEAHDTAVGFHRKKRDEKTLITELTEYEGIGKKLAKDLLAHFKSVKKIKEASIDELAKIIGKKRAETLYSAFQAKE